MRLSSTAIGILASKFSRNPFYVRFHTTYRCNYMCKMCGQRQQEIDPSKELSISQIQMAAEKLAHMKARHVVITGGEPFMRKDLAQIIAAFHKYNFSIRIQTNGGPQVTAKRLTECVDAGLNDISVSMDTMNKNVQDEICQREGVVDNALRTLDLARQLIPNGISQANIVASQLNFTEIPSLVRFFYSKGIYSYITPVMTISENEPDQSNYLFRSQNDSFEICGISTETIDNVTSELIRLRKDRFGLTNSSRFLQDYRTFLFTGNQSWRCEAGLLSLDILPDGSVAVCKEKEPIGNILDQNFEAYYRSRAYRDRGRSISEACSGCFYGEYREPQYAIRDYRVLQEWIRDWFRVFRHGMRFHSPKSNSISLNP